MRYSTESRDRPYVKGYGFLSFVKNFDKNLSRKYVQKIFEITIDALKKPQTVLYKKGLSNR